MIPELLQLPGPESTLPFVPFLFLYAETHFRFFRFFPNFLYRRSPEILFDMPARLDPGHDLPVMLLINDIDRFPVDITEVTLSVSSKSERPFTVKFESPGNHLIDHPMSWRSKVYLFEIPRSRLKNTTIYVNGKAEVRKGKRKRTYPVINDNLITSSKTPLICRVSDTPLPGSDNCSYGDLHVHSQFSQSHVEFGPPVAAIDRLGHASGIDFIGITDHSYDIACRMDNYLEQDPALQRWSELSREIKTRKFKTLIVLGEEISCLNSRKNVVHLCGLGLSDFIPGSSDGARRNVLHTKELSIHEAVNAIHDQNGAAVAAHIGAKPGRLQKIFLHRGIWNSEDLEANLDGIQGVNTGFTVSWERSKALWIKKLQQGLRIPLIAGNDAHGDFNRYRYLGIPFLLVKEMFERYLGYAKTGTYGKVVSTLELVNAIKEGRTFVTNGPYLGLGSSPDEKDTLISNNETKLDYSSLYLVMKSTYEFGKPEEIRLFCGEYAPDGSEKTVFHRKCANFPWEFTEKIAITGLPSSRGYLRAEAECKKEDDSKTYAFTSACYFYR
ncbi:MAG: hypothetical protein GF401_16875 [Chitinivibrionales bacterium]|nr:hypothetical protein [Chitinivibrionales bacterium]